MKMKSLKAQFIGAIAMVLVAAIAMGSSTYAWFAMNNEVKATDMKVVAQAEAGLVIANSTKDPYNATAAASKTAVKSLIPGSTWNLSNWYHSVSTDPAQANTTQAYTAATEDTHYVTHEFYIRSSANAALTVGSLDIKKVEVSTTATQELSKALRVGILVDGDTTGTPAVQNVYIYAPVTGFTATYTVHQSSDAETAHTKSVTALGSASVSNTAITSIPANNADGIHVTIYVWYEGEDAACISNNLDTSIENLNVNVTFGYTPA